MLGESGARRKLMGHSNSTIPGQTKELTKNIKDQLIEQIKPKGFFIAV